MYDYLKLPHVSIPNLESPSLPNSIYDQYEEVNRLIIIGNGFDLAHGLKTSFKDFIEDYFYSILKNIKDDLKHEDPLISITSKGYIDQLIPGINLIQPDRAYKELKKLMKSGILTTHWKSDILDAICNDIDDKNWVDIELIYFDLLKEANKSNNEKSINDLNCEMTYLKKKLICYLKREVENQKTNYESNLNSYLRLANQFLEPISILEVQPNTIRKETKPSFITILNFNYTHTPKYYFKEFKGQNYDYISIHGELEGNDNDSQSPIFGFGDELDEEYLKFELQNNDNLYEHIKSFKYLQFDHYRKLLEFIEGLPFQVHLYGHSCGLSDRTMLSTIFENENCISIKIFFHEKKSGNDYEKKTFAISRHFKSKASLRSKVVNKRYCSPMVQPVSDSE
ncbi:bacteriophage abortive infection AbiH family protein [Aquiflexum gelatinilyticum]|uniref:bacteriophage abortive infection AbiH family protein n=1 Tax=Aquiflexum gelatinilyticum TaxID=2961943 RepID=UPI00216A09B9|nr:bacteriophage abortive infection AbiH family protein [Aquiflexum gelatinilyticum]MCS4436226.1 bacteriophage abortive infection AbiH family protein [Aquiflexum gelatinilyticum]